MRYGLTDAIDLLGSVGTGFRAPTSGQISTTNVSTRINARGFPVAQGVFPADDPASGLFGGRPLEAEDAVSFTLGVSASFVDGLNLTLDYYYVELSDRIVLSSVFELDDQDRHALQALGVVGATDIAELRFFTNDVDTSTSGIDLVASYEFDSALGTLAALGLSSPAMPGRTLIMSILISPMITPVIIVAVGMFFFYSGIGLAQTYLGLILAHTALGAPFVVITVTATLSGFDRTLMRAAASLGAGPLRRFFRVQLPLISPGVFSGGLFAFAASFDEVVVVLFMGGIEQRTIPRQMWSGIREQISPTILAVAVFLVIFAVLALLTVEWLRSRPGTTVRASPAPAVSG